ncbi:uncharacterized protein LOC104888586 [Beta vulgaris subsp. vulgaris]|uniref:uncharacterized protein LOC104888586 n=1 Tax=Beta vulgaris subsp. vulgaris TaxID=3555 RepID=UPI0020374F52|nr:uncharacterized protein LOC104888586 [Beta vulgaris subsp. vulgaris]
MREKEERENPPKNPQSLPTALTAQSLQPPCQLRHPTQAEPEAAISPSPKSPAKPPDLDPPPLSFKLALSTDESVINEPIPLPLPLLPFATARNDLKEGEEIFVPISEDEYAKLSQPWESAIIFKVLGRSFSQDFLTKEISKLWNWKGHLNLLSLGKGFYSIKCFSNVEESKILSGGPWFILGSLVWVQPWTPGFKPSTAKTKHYPVWVQLPELPMELFHKQTLEKIGNTLGETLKIDSNSLDGVRRRYAAICVLMKEDKTVPQWAWLGGLRQEIACVEGPWVCEICRKVGHNRRHCALAPLSEHKAGDITGKEMDGNNGTHPMNSGEAGDAGPQPGLRGILPAGKFNGTDGILLQSQPSRGQGINVEPTVTAGNVQASHNVRRRSTSPGTHTASSGCITSPSSLENLHQVVAHERGRSRNRRKKSPAKPWSLDRPHSYISGCEDGDDGKITSDEAPREKQHQCTPMRTVATPIKTNGSHGELGRGKRAKKPTHGRSYSVAPLPTVDITGDRGRVRSLGSRKRGATTYALGEIELT